MEQALLEVEKYVTLLLTEDLPHTLFYHNLTHTQRVVKKTKELIKGEDLDIKDYPNLIIAAWFHDTGYIKGCDGHEENSVTIANAFLKKLNYSENNIAEISSLIMATKMSYHPQNIQEKIIRDADASHFASKNYMDIGNLLREEWKALDTHEFSDIKWIEENISFFTKHHRFYTNYAQENWQKNKDRNLASLFKTLKKAKQEAKKEKVKSESIALKKNKAKTPERGIETLFRVTLRNHITLSDIADTKANILLSVNAIIVSLVLSNLVSKLDNNPYLIWPTVIFVAFTVSSMILSVLATRPNVTSGKFTKEDVVNKKVNLLFFGNFHKMSLDDFEWAINEVMKDKDYLYSSMTKDLYFLGRVLDKKYNILRITYTVFIVGIIASVIAFGIAFQFADIP